MMLPDCAVKKTTCSPSESFNFITTPSARRQVDTKDLDVAAVIFMAVMVGAGAFMLVHHRDTVFGLTLIWTFVGVYEAAKDRGAEHSVQYAALGSVVLVTILCLVSGRSGSRVGGATAWRGRENTSGKEMAQHGCFVDQ